MAGVTSRGILLSSLSPQYLHSNSTSHTWPFSAIAELIDNAYDPDVSAKQFWINKTVFKEQDCLIFMDNGKGMDYDKMHKMLSFGFSDKQTIRGHVPVGLYGNGFKSGSMRLGKDAIVFSKKASTMCVGLLSQTYLEKIGAQNIMVPIVMFTKTGQTVSAAPEHAESLYDILTHSLFNTKEELISEFSVIDRFCTSPSGTRIIIWNLQRTPSGELEYNFRDPNDIQLPVDVYKGSREKFRRQAWGGMSVPESEYSLRAYCSILYLKPRMQIILQGLKVETQYVEKTLAKVFTDTYKPVCLTSIKKAITITFGYNTKSKEHYGLMMYHKNRLIKAYERVACQRGGNNRGEGIIGVIVCNHLTPIHNKQDFEKNEEYWRTMSSVGKKLEEYWKQVHFIHDTKCNGRLEDTVEQPDQQWVQCDACLKWRKLPDGVDPKKLPKRWLCLMNPDPKYRSCTDEEEPEDSNDGQHRYQKTYKQHEQAQKFQQRQQEKRQQQSTLSSIQTTFHHSGNTSANTLHSSVLTVPKRKKKALDLGCENPEKKKARRKGFDESIPDLSTCLPLMFNDDSDASELESNNIKTALTDEGVEVIKSMEKKEESNQMPQTSSEDQQDYKMLYLQVIQAIKHNKLIELKKDLNKEGVDTKMNSLEYEKCRLSTCHESLQKDLEKINTKSKNMELSAKDCAAPSTQVSKPGGERYLQLQICEDETQDKSGSEKGHTEIKMPSHLRLIELRQRVDHLLVNFIPAVDRKQVTDDLFNQFIDVISPEVEVMLTKETEIQEAHLPSESKEDDNFSISTQPSYTRHHSADVFIPEPVKQSANSGAYRFLCSHTGQFHCKLTNLIFEMKGSGEVTYTVVPWDKSQLQVMGQFQPAGPLYNIKCSKDSILHLHIPHCEIATDNNQIELAVAHFGEDNVEILQPLKIKNTHVILKFQGLSIFGLLKKWMFVERPISAQVLLFYKEIIENQRMRTLHIHLLPGNVPVEEVQKQHQGSTYLQCSSIGPLTPGKKYKPLCEPHVFQPKVEAFGCDFGPYYYSTFKVILNTEVEDLTLGLLDETGQVVWEPRQVSLIADKEAIPSETD
ncbi:MORC family CW-type zinc finger protein 3-like [Clarias gariepinus]|uniref:MORC family CW-type zinc finger protein 3-like n=1 Tax=Clarias gariepinus TaxID=13013 RepID=UPI00234C3218|nr:MORC family CW-type zinc finger protein 3-like [Clarias gariepinus]